MNLIYSRTIFVLAFVLLFATESYAQLTANFSATPSSGCAPLLVTFTDLSTGSPSAWNWDFGDGTGSSSLQSPQHNYSTPGQYSVTLTVTSGSSSNTVVKTNYITVFRSPVAGFDVTPDTICSGQSVTLTSTSIPGDGAITDYTWTFNDGNPPVTGNASISHVYNNATSILKIFTPVLLINDANGCNSTISDSVFVFPSPNASFSVGSMTSCATPATVNFSNASTGTSTFTWDFGDPSSGASNTSTLTTPSHTYNTSGSYLVTLTAGVPGCNSIDTMTVQIMQPVASFTVNDSTVCRFSTVNYTNTSTPSGATVSWNFGDPASGANNTSVLQNPSHFYSTPGTYVTTLTVTAGSCTSTRTMNILVRPNPSALFFTADNMACETPFVVTFQDTVSNIATWSWTFGDPASGASNTSTTQNPTHTYNNFGIYDIKLVVVDIYGCTDSLTRPQYIQVIQPVVNISQMDSGCVGETFNFLATVISPANPNVQSYVWNFGDGTGNITGTGPSISHQFNNVGIYDVSCTITTTDGCTASVTRQGFIRVGTQPNANFSATPLQICFKGNVQFTDLTPAPVTGWLWDFGDGGSSTSQNPNHQYNLDTSTVADPFDVTLIAFYNGCPDTINQPDLITVLSPLPNFDIAYDCANPYTVTFTNLSGGATSYNWNFGDASPNVSTTNPVHTFPSTGTFNVTLTATSTTTGCVIDTVLPVNITVPTAVITVDDSVACHAATINFSSAGSTDVSSLIWTFGEGIAGVRDTSLAADTLHLYNRPGFYTATLTVTDIHGCVGVQTKQIHVIGPTAGFTANPLGGCAPVNVTFTDTSRTEGGAISSWVWNYGGGTADTTSSVGVVTHNYNNPGLYSITLTVTDVNGCTDTHISPSYINPSRPTAGIVNDTLGCRGVGEIFNASSGSAASPVSYTWDFGDSSTPVTVVGSSTTSHSYSANGLYPVYLLLVDANGCRDSILKNIFIYTTPASFTVATTDTCVDQGGIKKAQVYGSFHSDSNLYVTNWAWNVTVDSVGVWTSPDYFYTYNVPPGSYDASLVVTNSLGCRDTAYMPAAVVVAGPTGSFSFSPSTGCSPLTVNFTGVATGSSTYAWDFDDGNVINGTTQLNVSHTYYGADVYYPQFYLGFQLTNSFCYISTPVTDSITVTSLISADIDSTLMCITDGGQSSVNVSVSDLSYGPYTYTWSPASYVTPGTSATNFNVTTSGQSQYYTVAVGYGLQGCAAFDSVRIDYCPCLDIIDSIPNVFTPNGDNKNDFFEMRSLCYYQQFRIIIFNRWGKKMYESNNPYFKWDGRTEGGTEASEGVYYWIMDTKSGQLHGYLELIRK